MLSAKADIQSIGAFYDTEFCETASPLSTTVAHKQVLYIIFYVNVIEFLWLLKEKMIHVTGMTRNSILWISESVCSTIWKPTPFKFCRIFAVKTSVCSRLPYSRLMFLYCHPDWTQHGSWSAVEINEIALGCNCHKLSEKKEDNCNSLEVTLYQLLSLSISLVCFQFQGTFSEKHLVRNDHYYHLPKICGI